MKQASSLLQEVFKKKYKISISTTYTWIFKNKSISLKTLKKREKEFFVKILAQLYLNSTYSRFSQHLISLVILANNFANSTIGMFQRLLVIFSFFSWWKSLTTLNGISQRRSGRVDRCWSRWRWISGTFVPNRWRSHVYIAIKVCDSSVSSEGKKWWTNINNKKNRCRIKYISSDCFKYC